MSEINTASHEAKQQHVLTDSKIAGFQETVTDQIFFYFQLTPNLTFKRIIYS